MDDIADSDFDMSAAQEDLSSSLFPKEPEVTEDNLQEESIEEVSETSVEEPEVMNEESESETF